MVEHTRYEKSLSNGPNIEESVFFGIFVTACHLLRRKTMADINEMTDDVYSHALECSRSWFAGSESVKEIRFRQEIKNSLEGGAFELLAKTSLSPYLTILCVLMRIRGDLSPPKLAKHLLQSGVFPYHSVD